MAGAKTAARKGMKLSEKAQAKKDKKTTVVFRVENPLQIPCSETSILFCSSVLGNVVYAPCRGNERILNKFADSGVKDVVLTIIKVTGQCKI